MGTKSERRNNVASFFDDTTQERILSLHPVKFEDDFCGGDLVIPAAGSAESGVSWVKKITGAGPPTVAKDADAASGTVTCALTATSEKQDADLYFGDQRNFSLLQGCIFEARVKVSVLPSGTGVVAVWGLAGDWVDGPDAITYSSWFATRTADAGVVKIEADDNATDQTESSGVTVTNAQWKIYRIDFTSVSAIRYYIDGVGVGSTKAFAATGADAVLQPFVGVYKASGTGVGSLAVDYIRVFQNRS